MESILTSIKKMLGIVEEYEHFDADLTMHINSAFAVLNQLGVGPSEGFSISDKTATWRDFTKDDSKLDPVKSYIYLKVKMIFDPPQSSAIAEAYKNQISEFEWRLNVTVDPREEESQNGV